MFSAQLATLLCIGAYVQAGADLRSLDYSDPIRVGGPFPRLSVYHDLKNEQYKVFYDNKKAFRILEPLPNQMQVQCENSPYCDISAAKISSVRCMNANRGSPDLSWDCDPSFYGSGYSISTSNIDCEKSIAPSDPSTSVLRDSCIYTYTPQVSWSLEDEIWPVAVFGGIFVICAVGLAIFLRSRRMNRSNSSRGITTTTVFSTAPPPIVPTQAYAATQACPSAPSYPSKPDYAPPYAAPYPRCAPQCAQPEPPKYAPHRGGPEVVLFDLSADRFERRTYLNAADLSAADLTAVDLSAADPVAAYSSAVEIERELSKQNTK